MIKNKCTIFLLLIGFAFFLFQGTIFASEQKNESENKNTTTLTAQAQKMAGVVIATLEPKVLTDLIAAHGEVIPNANLTSKITTRVSAQVIQRRVQEGEHIKEGQILITLSSVDMAKTQAELLMASQEWTRMQSLGRDAVSGKRYSESQIAYQRAYSTALAYGMTEKEISELLRTQKPTQAKGEFNLVAPRTGTVFNMHASEGELIEPGRMLLQIVDEGTVWIDAKLPPDLMRTAKIGDVARIAVNSHTLKGRVIQVHHQLDETTRTRSVRVEVDNVDDLLHPGQFVNCQIEAGQTAPVLAVPTEAVIRTADGDSAVYVEKKQDEFQPIEVKVIQTIDNHSVIEGIAAGTRIVIKGAFFIHSELNKKGFDSHGH